MSKMKKVLTMCTAYVLVAALAIGGTMAYLTSEDEDENVMTLGNVSIEQHEFERVTDGDGNYTTIDVDGTTSYELKEFTQDKPLYPMVGDPNDGYDSTTVRLAQLGHNSRGGMDVLDDANVQDKFVVVENTGETDAYVRTLVAFEAGSVSEEDWNDIVNYSHHFTWKPTDKTFVVEVNGNNYHIVEFVYDGYEDIQHPNGVLEPGDYTYNSLAQVYLHSSATNEDVEVLDGNGNERFDILVLSQAVQAGGFENAKSALDAGFGEFNEENAVKWFSEIPTDGRIYVRTFAELKDAFKTGGEIVLLDDITLDEMLFLTTKTPTVLDMNGKTVTNGSALNDYDALIVAWTGSDLTITGNGTFEIKDDPTLSGICVIGGNITIENATIVKERLPYPYTEKLDDFMGAGSGGTLTIYDCYLDSGYYDPNVEKVEEYIASKETADAATKNAIYSNAFKAINNGGGSSTVVIYGGTYVGFNPAWGDEGCMMPDNLHPGKAYQGGFLEGQVVAERNREEFELPEGYSYTVGETDDGRITYTINYSK